MTDVVQDKGIASMTMHMGESVRIQQRNYFSGHMLWGARDFADQLAKIEADGLPQQYDQQRQIVFWRQRALAFACVQSTVSFLEGAINEFLKDLADGQTKLTDTTLQLRLGDLWRFSEGEGRGAFGNPLRKYECALEVAGAKFAKGQNPYQDADLLVRLRNELVHYKPETVSVDDEHDFTGKLQHKFPENKLKQRSPYEPWYPDGCFAHGCCEWAIKTALAFADYFFGQFTLPNAPPYKYQIPH